MFRLCIRRQGGWWVVCDEYVKGDDSIIEMESPLFRTKDWELAARFVRAEKADDVSEMMRIRFRSASLCKGF